MQTRVIENTETETELNNSEKNRIRWNQYVGYINNYLKDEKLAYLALTLLLNSIQAKCRWLRISQEEFLKLVPDWNETIAKADFTKTLGEETIEFKIYIDPVTGERYFNQLFYRKDEHSVLKGWHAHALNMFKTRNIKMSRGLNQELYRIGVKIVGNIHGRDGIWQVVNNPKSEIYNGVEENTL